MTLATETPMYDIQRPASSMNKNKYKNNAEIKYKNTINCKLINVCSIKFN